ARQHGLVLTVADCGVAREVPARAAAPGAPRLVHCRVAAGTQDASGGPAMSAAQCAQALQNGRDIVRGLPGNVLLLGEM
ncbi:nicotinate-nucleotide--dimethylbenzimidazole phosphoribosyltransferase, partial [Salmonella enterica]